MVLATLHFQSLKNTTHTPGVEQPHWDTSEDEDFAWRSTAPPMELTVLAENESTAVGSKNATRARFFLWRRGVMYTPEFDDAGRVLRLKRVRRGETTAPEFDSD